MRSESVPSNERGSELNGKAVGRNGTVAGRNGTAAWRNGTAAECNAERRLERGSAVSHQYKFDGTRFIECYSLG